MNLLIDPWIPIQSAGLQEKISLKQLLCGEKNGEICLPRDDMEFACLQLIVAITQVLFTPKDKKQLAQRIKQPLKPDDYDKALTGKIDWFDLEHPKTPFMQFRGVKAKETTGLEKLVAGIADGTNKAFVNPQGIAQNLCSSCAAIALYNAAYNCPSMGGGFKSGMRGSTPITVILHANTLRETIWYNNLTKESLLIEIPWHEDTIDQAPNYVVGTFPGKISATEIGLTQGLLWQPARFELGEKTHGACGICGCSNSDAYKSFNKEKFNYTIEGVWPHPLSARTFQIKGKNKEEKFPSFTTTQPTWVHLAKLVAEIDRGKEGYQPAPIIKQIKSFGLPRLNLMVGGYRNNQATILERRHEMFSLANGWEEHSQTIDYLILQALEYKKALRRSLYIFSSGIKEKFAGTGINNTEQFDKVFFQESEALIHNTLAEINFESPSKELENLYSALKRIVLSLFQQATAPYQQDPKMLKALAHSRRLLNKYLKDLETKGEYDEQHIST